MSYYPILLDLEGKTALVVGGGDVAERKMLSLLDCGASIKIISREINDKIKVLVEGGRAVYAGSEFQKAHLDGVFLVIAATDDADLNRRVSRTAQARGLLINAVDQPSDCNFIVPSVVRRGDLILAVSTSGRSPALAKKIRNELEARFGEEYGIFLALMGRVRREVLSRGFPQKENSRIFEDIVHSGILGAVHRQDWEAVAACLREILPAHIDPEPLMADLDRG